MKEREIECLSRLFKLTNCYADLVDFLIQEKLLTQDNLIDLRLEMNKPKNLYEHIKKAEKAEDIILLSFIWVVLPVERIQLRLVTERTNKEFTYNY